MTSTSYLHNGTSTVRIMTRLVANTEGDGKTMSKVKQEQEQMRG